MWGPETPGTVQSSTDAVLRVEGGGRQSPRPKAERRVIRKAPTQGPGLSPIGEGKLLSPRALRGEEGVGRGAGLWDQSGS